MIGAGPLLQQPATGMKVSWYDTRPRKGITPSWVGFIGYKICRVRVAIIPNNCSNLLLRNVIVRDDNLFNYLPQQVATRCTQPSPPIPPYFIMG